MPEATHPETRRNGEAPLEEIVDDAIARSEDGKVTLGALLRAWGDRSYGPLFIILGFIAGTPLAVVPGAAAVVGVIIAVLGLQMVIGLKHPWLPQAALRQSVTEENLRKMREKTEPTLRFLDRLITERWVWATGDAMRRCAAIFVMILGVVMVPFDVAPFIVAAPSWTVVLFGVAITARDGLVMVVALAACLGVAWLGFSAF